VVKTEVGCSSWVVHRNKESFGPDADVFRPERFLDADGEYHPHAALFAVSLFPS
jgi:cytochrome P450